MIGFFKGTIGPPINRIMHFYDLQHFKQLLNLIRIGSLWVCQNTWGHGRMILVEFGAGGCSRARVMTIFVSYVGPHFPNIEYFYVYKGI